MTEDLNGMPPKVAAAICAVMAEVPKLKKGEKNTHGNYNFASIDDFLEAVRPLCAKHGLIIAQDEQDFSTKEGTAYDKKSGKEKPTLWLIIRYSFTLAHSSGETWAHRPTRTIMVNGSMGSQAFGAAQSYALKQFMRAIFQIATGEKGMDIDEHAPTDLPKQDRVWAREEDAQEWKGPLGKHALKEKCKEFSRALKDCTDTSMLAGVEFEFKPVLKQCRDNPIMADWLESALSELHAKHLQLKAAEEGNYDEPNPIGAG